MDDSRSHDTRISWACRRGRGAISRSCGSLPGIPPQLSDVMEVSLFIASGSHCTLVSMNKRRARREINNEDSELKLEAGRGPCVCVCVFNLLNSERLLQTSEGH